MNENINLFAVIRNMRIARKLGKISMETQQRVIRRLNPRPSILKWEGLMALRATIEKEIRPAKLAKMEAEKEAFQVSYAVPARKPVATVTAKVTVPVLAELNADWWREAGRREKANRKANRNANSEE